MVEISLKKMLHAAGGSMLLDVELEIRKGELLSITGPSGSGKTTLLRLIAGLAQPDEGFIRFDGHCWLDTRQRLALPPQERRVGMVFQDYALFPNMTVRQNLEYALAPGQPPSIIDELIEITELKGLEKRYPKALSGGQQQRVALARSLVRQPRLLLLDEPLSALDAVMRARLQTYILRVQQAYQLTTILVSHDHREIFRMSDRAVALRDGRISQPPLPHTVRLANGPEGNFHLNGEVISIEEDGGGFIATILVGDNLIRVPASLRDIQHLQPGDTARVSFLAYQPELRH